MPAARPQGWRAQSYRGHQSIPDKHPDPIKVEGAGELLRFQDFGGLLCIIPGTDARARQEVFSNAGGGTYWVYATAPADDGTPAPLTGTEVEFEQEQVFRKLRDDARLTYVIAHATVDVSDGPCEIVYKQLEGLEEGSDPVTGAYRRVKRRITLPDYVQTCCDEAIRASLSFNIAGRHGLTSSAAPSGWWNSPAGRVRGHGISTSTSAAWRSSAGRSTPSAARRPAPPVRSAC